jgi:hypothetical protein
MIQVAAKGAQKRAMPRCVCRKGSGVGVVVDARRQKKALRVADPEGETEREGFEPPSPFGRSLSRRVQYHSASAPKRRHEQSSAAFDGLTNRGARIRTGDLCDPNAALYRTEPRPGSYSGQKYCGFGFLPKSTLLDEQQ